jgi:hypothetical protein
MMKKILLVIFITSVHNIVLAQDNLRKTGDVIQYLNPMIASYVASQEKAIGHFALIYGQSFLLMGLSQYIGKYSEMEAGKRPDGDSYSGMPSGHTTSAWSAASYVRIFGGQHKIWALPLYAGAFVTGYSRYKAKRHTITQILAAGFLSELVNIINSKAEWSKNYQPAVIEFAPNSAKLSLKINL